MVGESVLERCVLKLLGHVRMRIPFVPVRVRARWCVAMHMPDIEWAIAQRDESHFRKDMEALYRKLARHEIYTPDLRRPVKDHRDYLIDLRRASKEGFVLDPWNRQQQRRPLDNLWGSSIKALLLIRRSGLVPDVPDFRTPSNAEMQPKRDKANGITFGYFEEFARAHPEAVRDGPETRECEFATLNAWIHMKLVGRIEADA